jgi:PAS domain S-box-containing protein
LRLAPKLLCVFCFACMCPGVSPLLAQPGRFDLGLASPSHVFLHLEGRMPERSGLERSVPAGGMLNALGLWVRVPERVVTFAESPWWNQERLQQFLGVMGALMLLTAAWVIILRRQVRAKTGEIREWLRREAALKERYQDLLENSIDIVYTRDMEGNITSWNNTAERILGYSREEALHMTLEHFVVPEYKPLLRESLENVNQQRPFDDIGFEVLTKNGARLTVEVRTRVLYENGKPVGVQGVARNVTERKLAEQQLHLQAAALKAAAIGIVITDARGVIYWVNPAFTTISGYSLEEAVGKNPRLLKSGVHSREFYREMWNTVLSGRVWQNDIVNRRKDGTVYNEELTITPVRDAVGVITHFLAIAQDITLRKRAEELQRESQERFRLLFAGNPLPMWVYDLETRRFLEVNDAAVDHYGYSRDEFLKLCLPDIRPPDDVSALEKNLAQARPDLENSGPWRHRLKSGRIIYVDITSHLMEWGGRRAALVVAQDITIRKRAEEALRESQSRLEAIFDSVQTGIFVIDPETHRIVDANPVALDLVGTSRERVAGVECHKFICPAEKGRCPLPIWGRRSTIPSASC